MLDLCFIVVSLLPCVVPYMSWFLPAKEPQHEGMMRLQAMDALPQTRHIPTPCGPLGSFQGEPNVHCTPPATKMQTLGRV